MLQSLTEIYFLVQTKYSYCTSTFVRLLLLEGEHDLVPSVPELHGAVIAGGVEGVGVNRVGPVTWNHEGNFKRNTF